MQEGDLASVAYIHGKRGARGATLGGEPLLRRGREPHFGVAVSHTSAWQGATFYCGKRLVLLASLGLIGWAESLTWY